MHRPKILIVDDEPLIRWSLNERLEREGFEVVLAETGNEGLRKMEDESPRAVFLDIRLPDMDGMALLSNIKERDPGVVVIMITAYGNVETAVKAMKLGAHDYVNKPFNLDEVVLILNKALENVELKEEVYRIRGKLKGKYTFENMVGRSRPMLEIYEAAHRVAQSDTTTVLIQGESGTGKDMLARAIHYHSLRADRPLMEIDCSSLTETLVESELFGHERGAFTDAKTLKKGLFELGDGGSILLDEIGDVPLSVQAKLLRIIEEKTFKRVGGIKEIRVDARIICTTNQVLEQAIRQGRFRNDLYFRLRIIPLYVPPLRERLQDVPPLAEHFVNTFNKEFKKKVKGLSKEAIRAMENYHWPGNVRELRNVIERAIILGDDDTIEAKDLALDLMPLSVQEQPAHLYVPQVAPAIQSHVPQELNLREVEIVMIKRALALSGANQTKAAHILGISRDTLKYRLKKFEIQ